MVYAASFISSLLFLQQWHLATGVTLGMGSKAAHYQLMADMGLNPDGSVARLAHIHVPTTSRVRRLAAAPQAPPRPVQPEYVELKLDQFSKDNSSGTFRNRFWVSASAYKPGGPVFFYDTGEANAAGGASFRLQNDSSFFKQMVDDFGGIGIVWEHRFYGESTPVNISLKTPAKAFKYLTTEQALADVAAFADKFSRRNISYDLTPAGTPWIFFGGSYPGMRAAFIRDRYPDTILASFASSAPVQAAVDMSFYFDPVYDGMIKYGWGNCTKDIMAGIKAIDDLLEIPAEAAKLKLQFFGRGADKSSNAGFADALATLFANWQVSSTNYKAFYEVFSNTFFRVTVLKAAAWAFAASAIISVPTPRQRTKPHLLLDGHRLKASTLP